MLKNDCLAGAKNVFFLGETFVHVGASDGTRKGRKGDQDGVKESERWGGSPRDRRFGTHCLGLKAREAQRCVGDIGAYAGRKLD